MAFFLYVFYLLSILRLVTAQSTAPSAAPSAAPSVFINPSESDLGILQLVTPTTHANQVPLTALDALQTDIEQFYISYTQIDPFDFGYALGLALQSPSPGLNTLDAGEDRLIQIYADGVTSLLDNPTSYLSRLHVSASPWPSAFSSSLMSQATGILLGYESLVSQDVLSKNSSSGPVTPGMIIAVGPAMTSTSAASSAMGATQASQGMGTAATTSPSKAAGVPVVTASPLLLINAAAVAMGVFGVAMM
ncbi:hypothetical protein MMC18_009135 [Xylographa bjoerkii]|nr:hypothetical protein [Xylographa bjoerkii]